jgi:hypothetical protein
MLEYMTLLKKMAIDRPNNDKVKQNFDGACWHILFAIIGSQFD